MDPRQKGAGSCDCRQCQFKSLQSDPLLKDNTFAAPIEPAIIVNLQSI